MGRIESGRDPAYADFIARYNMWLDRYALAGNRAPDAPLWEAGRLHLRFGYPNEGWSAYVVDKVDGGYNVSAVTTERRSVPSEGVKGFFANIDDAGKYVIWNIGENLRVSCRLDPVGWAWEDAGLDRRVDRVALGDFVSRYSLKSDPARYFTLYAGGVQPENRLLPLTYDELDRVLTAGLPGLR